LVKSTSRIEFLISNESMEAIDPDKFYVAFIDGSPVHVTHEVMDKVGKYFKKGGMLVLNKKDSIKEYSVEDLENMKEGITHFLDMLKKRNKTSYNRFDIIKGDVPITT
jgi:precorrin-6B methylase 2